jgi:transcriptional regulator with XRE-family HTH domain
MNPKHKPNNLETYRRRMRLSQERVVLLMGYRDNSAWSKYERGERLPSLVNALKLGIILRVPIEFLFHALHEELRDSIRAMEEHLDRPTQQVLF